MSSSIHDLLTPSEDGPRTEVGNPQEGEAGTGKPIGHIPGKTTHFTIELIIDTICPHCYIGMKNLNAAIELHKARHPEVTFELVCSPLILHPATMRNAMDKISYYTHTHGGQKTIFEKWNRVGTELGVNFSWKGRTGNTRDSHKLLRFALESNPTTTPSTEFARQRQQQQSAFLPTTTAAPTKPSSAHRGPALQMRLLEALFKGYFEHDRDVSDHGFLVEVGTSVGAGAESFTATDVRNVLESEDWGLAIDVLSDEVRSRLKVDAVPTIIVNGLSLYGGWQKPELFVAEFERLGQGIARRVSASGHSHFTATDTG